MGLGGRKHVWVTVAAVATLLGTGCSAGSEKASPTAAPEATLSPTPLSTEPVYFDDRELPRVEAAYEDFDAAFDAGDWERVVALTTPDALGYFRRLQNSVAAAGPDEIRRLDTYQRMAIAVVRAAPGPGPTESRPMEGFLALLNEHRVLGNASGELALEIDRIEVFGDKANTLIPTSATSAWEIDFELHDDQWKVDLRDVMRFAGNALEGVAEKRGVPVETFVLRVASALTGKEVTPAVWDKP